MISEAFFTWRTHNGVSLLNLKGVSEGKSKHEIPKTNFTKLNYQRDAAMIEIPYMRYRTFDQKNGKCVSPKKSCKTDKDCSVILPNVRLDDPSMCKRVQDEPKV